MRVAPTFIFMWAYQLKFLSGRSAMCAETGCGSAKTTPPFTHAMQERTPVVVFSGSLFDRMNLKPMNVSRRPS